MKKITNPSFAPMLYINNGCKDVSFYSKAFGAIEIRRFSNDDGSIHVAEFSIDGAMFHVHEITASPALVHPLQNNTTTVIIGLFVEDVDSIMANAIAAGAEETNPAKDYEYGYRQGEIKDPFGHRWVIQKKI